MAYAFVQQNSADNAATATTITVTLTPTAGNLLVFCATAEAGDTSAIALSDNLGASNTFVQIGTDLVSVLNQRCTWWYAENCKGGATTFTATFTASARFRTIYVAEYSGIVTSGAFLNGARAESVNPGTGADAVSSGNANATSQPALVWGFSLNVNGGTPAAAGTGFTSRTAVWSSATCQGRPEDKRVTATGNVAATFTAAVGTDPHANGVGIFAETVSSMVDDDGAPPVPRLPSFVPPPAIHTGGDDDIPGVTANTLDDDATIIIVPRAWAWSLLWPGSDGNDLPSATALVTLEDDSSPPRWPGVLTWRRPPAPIEDALPVASIFPLTVDINGRFLRQSDGTPFLICGDSTWSIGVNLSAADQATFLDDCVARGITCVMANAIEHYYSVVKPPKDIDGNLPFTQRMDGASYTGSPNGTDGTSGSQTTQFAADPYTNIGNQAPDPTFINNTYWNRFDAFISACLARNIAVFIWPMYLGFHGNHEGWISELVVWDAAIGAGGFTGESWADPTKSKLWNYGAWLAARWSSYPNIVWVAGGDYGSGSQSLNAAQAAAVKSCIDGIKSVTSALSSLWTAHWDRPCISDDTAITGVTWDLNFAYSGDDAAEVPRRAYAVAATKPAYWGEGFYEAGLFGGTAPFRKYLWWGMLGGIAGGFFGHEQLWRFDDGTPGTLWSTLLATQGRLDAARQFAFLKSKPWYRLIPNGLGGIGTLITAGGGTASPQSTDYVAAACTPQGDLLLAYIPPAHAGSITVAMSKLTGPITASWFDPTDASLTAIGSFSNTGTQAFTPPATNSVGDTDFLLVLETDGAILDDNEIVPRQLPLNAATWNHTRWKPWFPYDAEDLPIPGPPSTSAIDDREDIVGLLVPPQPVPWLPAARVMPDDDLPLIAAIDDDSTFPLSVGPATWVVRPVQADEDFVASALDEDRAIALVSQQQVWIAVRGTSDSEDLSAAVSTAVEDDQGIFSLSWPWSSWPRPPAYDEEAPLSPPAPISGSGDITLSDDTVVGSDGSQEATVPQRVLGGSVGSVGPQRRPNTHVLIRIEDVDRGVRNWFDRVADVHVMTPQGDRRKVTVKFASGERWVAAADRQGIRDRDGRLILPVIQIRRTGIDSASLRTALGANVPRLQMARLVSEKTSDLANLDTLRPISQRRLRGAAVYDIFTIPFPSTTSLTYRVRVQCQYQSHLNEVIEKILSKLEFYNVPSFVVSLADDVREVGIRTGDGSTELSPERDSLYEIRKRLSDYYVVGYIDGDIGDEGNMDEFTDQERILQLQFTFSVPVALMLDPEGERPPVQRERTAFQLRLGDEEVHQVDDPAEADRIFGREK